MEIQERNEILKLTRAYAEQIIKVCDDIESGMSESGSCQKNDVNVANFRKFAKSATVKYCRPDMKSKINKETFKNKRECFVSQILQLENVEVRDDFEQSLDYVCKIISDDQAKFIKEYYLYDMTTVEIAKEKGCTSSNVDSMIKRGIDNIRKSQRRMCFVEGYEVTRKRIEAYELIKDINAKLAEYDEIIDWLHIVAEELKMIERIGWAKVEDLKISDRRFAHLRRKRCVYVCDLYQIPLDKLIENFVEKYVEEEDIEKLVTLEDLNFSARTHNALLRSGIKTLGDILELSEHQLMKIRNLGRISCNEVIAKVKEYGFTIRENGDPDDELWC